ncbi:MAG: hypothetical protein HY557_03480 [Euryarchaeota archaeon]|nr:hypothetical protein [Euryarchaeota archaeon]
MATAQATGGEAVRRVLRRYLSLIALGIVLLLAYILYTLPPDAKASISSALQGLRGGAIGGLMLAYSGTLLLVGA